uniref:Reverse transcriptase domain-containing protein n=1 Tax=Cannabis sativa TaxID=3483 RepID=A0A803PSQ1_CANSA
MSFILFILWVVPSLGLTDKNSRLTPKRDLTGAFLILFGMQIFLILVFVMEIFFGSDHKPLILTLHNPADQTKLSPRFIFDKLWMSEPGFEDCLCITECLTEAEVELLQATFSATEIKKAAFQLANDKALGLDGFSGCFFENNWHLLGKDIITAAQSFLNGDADLAGINKTVLVNRLKPILSRIISPNQSAFLPNCLISDNIIIGQEVMHSLSHRQSGRLGWMALKLDMAKAFDHVEWVFVRRVLGHFKPTRGIRQGDPLSPYLFILCSEGLSSLIHLKTQQIQPRRHSLRIKIARRAPSISHLFFADDSLLFSSTSPDAATIIKQILSDYSLASGQLAMLAKQAWRLLQSSHSLVATLLKSRYFPHCSFLNSGKGHRPSLVWTSITWGKELLKSGLRRSIGDDTTISIFNDALIPGYGKLHYLRHQSDANMTVENLLTPTKDWNLTLLQATFPEDVTQAILSIPLTNISATDAYSWHLHSQLSWLHAGFSSPPAQVLREVTEYMDQYQSCNDKAPTIRQPQDVSLMSNGSAPSAPNYNLQLSVDAAQDTQLNKMSFGMSIQTNKGEVLLYLAKPWHGIPSPLLMEAQALHLALFWCHTHSFYLDSIVSNCKVLVDYICNNDTHNLHLNHFVTEINSLLSYFPKTFLSYISRGANEAAHCLARKALGLDQEALGKSCSLQL